MERYRAGVLGATGMVGQNLLRLLDGHPWFQVVGLAASPRSVGKSYGEATGWCLAGDPPAGIGDQQVRPCEATAFDDCDLVFSGLDSATAREVEPSFADAGMAVVSNASAYRRHEDVPLIVPEINREHLGLLERQAAAGRSGCLVTNPNCSVTGLALVLAPLHRAFGVQQVIVTTLQALSGAGKDGPGAFELTDNVIPHIEGEEEKIEFELTRLLGAFEDGAVRLASIDVSAHCHRVATLDGHLEAVSVAFERPASPEEVAAVLREFRGDVGDLDLPSSPAMPIVVRPEHDRPQPRLDRDAGNGMSAVVGRIRPCPVLGTKLELLSHNTVRGAAGAAVLNAELLAATGKISRGVPH